MSDSSLTANRPHFNTMEPSASRRPAPAPGMRRKPAKIRKFSLKRSGYAMLIGICALAAIGVPINALFFQEGRHPAPLFLTKALTSTSPAPSNEKTDAARPMEPHSPTIEATKVKTDTPHVSLKSESKRNETGSSGKISTKPAFKSADTTKRDPIAELLNDDAGRLAPTQNDVLMAQKALLKLGYVVRADGKFNRATRQAIEKFEYDTGMPVRGLLTTKIAGMLASRSGLQSE